MINCKKYFIFVNLLLFSFCLCDTSVDQEEKPMNGLDYNNNLSTQIYPCVNGDVGSLPNKQQVITPGEEVIEIPRIQPSAPCVGCASHVNTQAAGVSDLASLGVRHLDIHEPTVKHSLDSVIDVERQVQVVNGVRYILTLSVKFNNCVDEESDDCASFKTCKISILVKPWVKLPNGGNYRAILGNNCTEEWQYGDNGEVLPEPSIDNHEHDANADDIQVKHNIDVQSQPNQERFLTDEEIKNIQDQIIQNNQFQESTDTNRKVFTISHDQEDSKQHVFKVESGTHSENSIPITYSTEGIQQIININPDKKKAFDDFLDFINFSGLKPKTEDVTRVRRHTLDVYRHQDPTKPRFKELAEESLKKYLRSSAIKEPLKEVEVQKAATQLLGGGVLTKLGFLVAGTENTKPLRCLSEVWDRPWLDKKDIIVSCQNDNQDKHHKV